MIGRKFGKWIVIREAGRKGRAIAYLCGCECGRECIVSGCNLRAGRSLQCNKCKWKNCKKVNTKCMGLSKTSTYNIWRSLLRKCYEENHRDFHKYGANGITVCKEWFTFMGFYDEMGKRPAAYVLHLMFGRDCFSKENCRWVTLSELHKLIFERNKANTYFETDDT